MGSGFAIPAIPPAPKAPAFANEPSAGIEAGPAAPVDERDRAFGESTAVDRLPEGLVDAPLSQPPLSRTQEGSSRGETTAVDLIAPASEPPSPPSQIPPSGGTAVMASRPEVPARVEPASADATRMAIPVDARLAGVLAARPERPDPTPAPAPLDAARSHYATSVDPRVTAPMAPVSVAVDARAIPDERPLPSAPSPEAFNPSRTQPLGPAPPAHAELGAGPPPAPVGLASQGTGFAEPVLAAPAFLGIPAMHEPSTPGPVVERAPSQPTFAPSPSGQHAHATPGPALAPGEARQPAPAASLEARNAAFERRPSQGHYVDDDPPTPPLESSRPLVIGGAIGAVVLVLVVVGFALGGRKSAPVAEPTAPSSVAPITPTITNASASAATSAPPSTAPPSPVASESATPAPATPSAVASAGAFDATKAQASLDAVPGTQSECRKLNGPRGKWKATATFEPTGKVSDVELDKPFNRTPAGKCVIGHLKQAEVPAFAGPAQKASTIVTIAVAGK